MVAELARSRDVSAELRPQQRILSPERRESELYPRRLLVVGHTYQPPREFVRVADPLDSNRVNIVAGINERIRLECYRQIFEQDFIPDHSMHSLYGTLREWYKAHHSQEFEQIIANLQSIPDKEYRVLGDPYLHPILPLLSEQNQEMLIKIGKEAFEEDFGFSPKGFWPPETAISMPTLRALVKNGYEFVVLRSDQLTNAGENPVSVAVKDKNGERMGNIAVVHFDPEISGPVSYPADGEDLTADVDRFLEHPRFRGKKDYAIATDTEFYGHHQPFKDGTLKRMSETDVLHSKGFRTFDAKEELAAGVEADTDIYDDSSWSCPHRLGRWTGECNCDIDTRNQPYQQINAIKRGIQDLYGRMHRYGDFLDQELDRLKPEWRDEFVGYFLGTRRAMYASGDLGEAIERLGLSTLQNSEVEKLFRAQLARFTATTSCFGFFRDSDDRPERAIASENLNEIEKIVPEVLNITPQETTLYELAAAG